VASYTIERVRVTPAGNVAYQVVTDTLQRVTVTIPRRHATVPTIDTIVTHALANISPPPKPL
jgi:hypothetical protein